MSDGGLLDDLFWGRDIRAGAAWGTAGLSLPYSMRRWGKFADFARAVTAEMSIQFLKPVRVDEEIIVEAHETNFVGRNIFQSGEIRNAAGDVLARGTARFVIIAPKQ
jgi:acyl-coenzyme A thioesterase PaaI-like protein